MRGITDERCRRYFFVSDSGGKPVGKPRRCTLPLGHDDPRVGSVSRCEWSQVPEPYAPEDSTLALRAAIGTHSPATVKAALDIAESIIASGNGIVPFAVWRIVEIESRAV